MATQVIYPVPGNKLCMFDFYMVRQPILDRHQDPVAFELLFCATGTQNHQRVDPVLAHFIELNMERVISDLRGFVDIDEATLMSDVFQQLPRPRFVLNIPAAINLNDVLLQRVAHLAQAGFVFALDGTHPDAGQLQQLLPFIEFIRFDLSNLPIDALVALTSSQEFANKRLLVQNVDTLAQFDACLALGFDYFQGYYFAQPTIQPDRQLAPPQLAAIEIITLISTDADSAEIEERIKRDVSLGLHLLRLVNKAAVGSHRIDSLRQALMVLGRNQLLSWMQVMLYTQPRDNAASLKPLLMLATTRGKLLELIAQRHRPGNRSIADAAFTVGIMSLMDTLFGMPMAEIVRQIAVIDEVADALLERKGYYGELLTLAEASESANKLPALKSALGKLQLSDQEWYWLQSDAFDWSNRIAQELH